MKNQPDRDLPKQSRWFVQIVQPQNNGEPGNQMCTGLPNADTKPFPPGRIAVFGYGYVGYSNPEGGGFALAGRCALPLQFAG